jgi:hypothetical protein
MPFLLRRIRNTIIKTPLRQPVLWYRNRLWNEKDTFAGEYPKSGITWLRFLLYEVLTQKPATWPDVNRVIIDRAYAEPVFPNGGRMIPTHEPYQPIYHKAIYLVRDARDVVLSEYAFEKALGIFTGDLDAFIQAFLKGKVNGYGAWHRHVASWLDAADAGKVKLLIVKYEDMRRNPEGKLKEIVKFLGVERDSEAIRAAVENNSLEKMRAKEDSARRSVPASGKTPLRTMETKSENNRFVREGKVAGWRDQLTAAQLALIEQQAGPALARLGYPLSGASFVPASNG